VIEIRVRPYDFALRRLSGLDLYDTLIGPRARERNDQYRIRADRAEDRNGAAPLLDAPFGQGFMCGHAPIYR